MFITVYINDIVLFGADINHRVNKVIQILQNKLWMKDLGNAPNHLGMEVDVDVSKKTITLRKSTYF